MFLISNKKVKYRSPSHRRSKSKFNTSQVENRVTQKKRKIIAQWVDHHTPTLPTSSECLLPLTRTQNRSRIRAEFKKKIQDRFGLPQDATYLFLREHGRQERLSLSYGTVVLLNTYGTKLLGVVRFNERQYTGEQLENGKHQLTPESAKLFDNFNNSIMTLYQHATARHRITTNGATQAMKHLKQGEMFAMGFRGGYRKGVYGGMNILIRFFCLFLV